MAEPVHCVVTYWDPWLDFIEGDADEALEASVSGWIIPSRFGTGFVAIASEKLNQHPWWRCVTHLREGVIKSRIPTDRVKLATVESVSA